MTCTLALHQAKWSRISLSAAAFLALAMLSASPADAKRKGGYSSSGSKSQPTPTRHSEEAAGKSININLRSNQGSSTASATSATGGSANPGLLAAVQARHQEDAVKAQAEYDAKKAEYEREKASKMSGSVAKGEQAMDGKDALKASFSAVSGIPAGGSGQIFKVVDAQGRITFTDAPPNLQNIQVFQGAGRKSLNEPLDASSPFRNLPSALTSVVSRYPVVLFSGNNCAPCDQARNALTARGVPFQERTVRTSADVEALGRMSGGDATLPMTTIGSQALRGFSDIELSTTLDAAGYPSSSALPSGFRNPPATPLVNVDRSAVASNTQRQGPAESDGITFNNPRGNVALTAEEEAQRAARAAVQREAAAAQAANPAGIRF